MYRKIILFMLWASVAVGQSTSQYQIVVYNGDGDIKTNQVSIMDDLEIIKPAYFCARGAGDPQIISEKVTVIDGTIESGSVTNTWAIDQSYLLVGESGQFDIQFAHSNVTDDPIEVLWEGYYDGNPAHQIDHYLWNYTAGAWALIRSDAIPDSSGSDFSVTIPIPEPQSNYVNGANVVTSRWYHSSSAVGAHDFATDYTSILQAQLTVTNAGQYYVAGGFESCVPEKRFDANYTAGKFTNQVAGVYSLTLGGSGTGSTNTIFKGAIFTNGVITDINFQRKIGGGGDVGNAWGHGALELDAGTVIDARLTADSDGAHATFVNFHMGANKIDN